MIGWLEDTIDNSYVFLQWRNTRAVSVYFTTGSLFLIYLIGFLRVVGCSGKETALLSTSYGVNFRLTKASPDICSLFLFVFFFSPNFHLTRARCLNLSDSEARYSTLISSRSSFSWAASHTILEAYSRRFWWLNVTCASRIRTFVKFFLTKSQS